MGANGKHSKALIGGRAITNLPYRYTGSTPKPMSSVSVSKLPNELKMLYLTPLNAYIQLHSLLLFEKKDRIKNSDLLLFSS